MRNVWGGGQVGIFVPGVVCIRALLNKKTIKKHF